MAWFSTREPLPEPEQMRWRPLTNRTKEAHKRALAQEARKKAAQGRAAGGAGVVPIQIVAGGAPGLGKRR